MKGNILLLVVPSAISPAAVTAVAAPAGVPSQPLSGNATRPASSQPDANDTTARAAPAEASPTPTLPALPPPPPLSPPPPPSGAAPEADDTTAAATNQTTPDQPPGSPAAAAATNGNVSTAESKPGCPPYLDLTSYRTTNFTDTLNRTVAISPKRPSADRPRGEWIPGRATYYGTDPRLESIRVGCGEPPGQFGVIEQGSCGYTNSDGSLVFPQDTYAAAADTNEDFPGSCGRCYQVRCRSGVPENNGRQLRMSDLIKARPYAIKDNYGRDWPGNPLLTQDLFFVKCWDDNAAITVRVSDSCPCKYPIKDTGEIRTQNWCCGGNNHFDLSFWAFEKLAHPSYGVLKIEYRPVDCNSNEPLDPLPGFVNQTIYSNGIQPGRQWLPYSAKNTQLEAAGQGLAGGSAMCATLSPGGAVNLACRKCTRPGYQPFAKARALRFWIRSNTQSGDPFASSTPTGQLPPLKLFLMNDEEKLYCGAEIFLGSAANTTAPQHRNASTASSAESARRLLAAPQYVTQRQGPWYQVTIPLAAWACGKGSTGSLGNVDRVDFQNVAERDADICMDDIALV